MTSFGFYTVSIVSPTKAFTVNGASEIIVWNPQTMTISEETIELPDLGTVDGLTPYGAYVDRASAVRDGKFYLPYYYANVSGGDFYDVAPNSKIFVIDIATETVEATIDAPCPGLDHATLGPDGTIYFSAWVFAAGGAAAIDGPSSCVFQVPTSGEPSVAFTVDTLLPGMEGGAFRSLGNGHALLSVLDRSHAAENATVQEIALGENWRFYDYDFSNGTASVIESLPWNSGGQYASTIGDQLYLLVPFAGYASTGVYLFTEEQTLVEQFTLPGWTTRLFDTQAD